MDSAELDERSAERQASLRRHRRFATVCLLIAAALYVATHFVESPSYWVLLLRSGAEAGLIGGIADWFAVTALFRRPLGLPIPHTAIIPRNQARIGDGLGAFVERNFLAPELIAEKLRSADAAARIGDWLYDARNSRMVAERVFSIAPYVVDSFDDRETRTFFRETFSQQLRDVNLVPLITRLLSLTVASRQHQQLFDRALLLARELLVRHESAIYEKVEAKSSWWVPRRIDRKVARAIIDGVEEWLGELAQRDNPVRMDFDKAVGELIDRLQASPEFHLRLEEFKAQLLASPELQQLLEAAWDQLRGMMLRELADPNSDLLSSLTDSFRSLGKTLQNDADARRRLNGRLEVLVAETVVPFRHQIGRFISEVVRGWDARTVSERLESEVGRDLQFIRINGTLVGALVGCVLFVVTQLVFA
ncbi:DUF445 domain-containing protein [Alkalilimnicola ehrlichii]|nr:DUF445 domain-containing protein [Alkalilimnicola ehrlichii]